MSTTPHNQETVSQHKDSLVLNKKRIADQKDNQEVLNFKLILINFDTKLKKHCKTRSSKASVFADK